MLIAQSHSIDRNQPRSESLAHLVDLLRPLGKLATPPRPYNFFATISCRMCRSDLPPENSTS